MPKTNKTDQQVQCVGSPDRVWAVGAVHAELDKLVSVHDAVLEKFRPGDRLIYTGNYTGYGKQATECLDELLTFRRLILSMPGMVCEDITYLRGQQEEMLQKLLQLQFAPNPTDVLVWMLGNGMAPTLQSYGICGHEGIDACRSGVMSITRWTDSIRQKIRKNRGHEIFFTQLQRAAQTSDHTAAPMLFVHAGINADKPVSDQGDNFWWSGKSFETIHEPYRPYEKVIRGYDPTHKGLALNCITATIDGGCGFGGNLVAASFDRNSAVSELLEA